MTSTRPCKADRRRIIGAWLKVAVQVPLPGSAGLFSPVLCSVLVSLTFGIPVLLCLLSSLSYCLQAVASPGPVRPGLCSELRSMVLCASCRSPTTVPESHESVPYHDDGRRFHKEDRRSRWLAQQLYSP